MLEETSESGNPVRYLAGGGGAHKSPENRSIQIRERDLSHGGMDLKHCGGGGGPRNENPPTLFGSNGHSPDRFARCRYRSQERNVREGGGGGAREEWPVLNDPFSHSSTETLSVVGWRFRSKKTCTKKVQNHQDPSSTTPHFPGKEQTTWKVT